MTNYPTGRSERHECFQSAVEAFLARAPGDEDPTFEYDDVELTVSQACKLVWNMPDIFPSWVVNELRGVLEVGSWTYAAVARAMHAHVTADD